MAFPRVFCCLRGFFSWERKKEPNVSEGLGRVAGKDRRWPSNRQGPLIFAVQRWFCSMKPSNKTVVESEISPFYGRVPFFGTYFRDI